MIACLSLFASPAVLSAGTIAENRAVTTQLPVIPPALEKKVDKFKKNHPDMFSNKENKEAQKAESAHGGGVVYNYGGAHLLLIIIFINLF